MLLLTNETIATMNPAHSTAEVAMVDGACFAYVDGRVDVEDFTRHSSRGAWETLDPQGYSVMPSFNGSHLYFVRYVKTKLSVNLFSCTSLAEAQERLHRGLTGLKAGSGRWLLGEKWNQEQFTGERRFPTRRELDQVSTEYPVLIPRSYFHVETFNSRAPELLHINRDTTGHYGAFAEMDETGVPNSTVKENALDDVKAAIPSVGLGPLMEQVVQSQCDLLTEDLTNIQNDDFEYAPNEEPYAFMDGPWKLAGRGALKLCFVEQVLPTKSEALEEFLIRGRAHFGGDDRFRISTVKFLADDSLGAQTVFLREPYSDAPDICGLSTYPEQARLGRLVVTVHRHNMAVVVHVIGDGAAGIVLNAFQWTHAEPLWLHPRHGMVYYQILSEGQLRRMAKLDVTTSVQPVLISGDMHIVPEQLSGKRLAHSYAWGDMERLDPHMAFDIDCPVECFHLLEGVYCAVTRRDSIGNDPSLPEQALTSYQALYAYTVSGVYASGEERIKGHTCFGLLAGFLLVDRNLLTCPLEELFSARVLRIYVGGACVFRDPSF